MFEYQIPNMNIRAPIVSSLSLAMYSSWMQIGKGGDCGKEDLSDLLFREPLVPGDMHNSNRTWISRLPDLQRSRAPFHLMSISHCAFHLTLPTTSNFEAKFGWKGSEFHILKLTEMKKLWQKVSLIIHECSNCWNALGFYCAICQNVRSCQVGNRGKKKSRWDLLVEWGPWHSPL